MKLYVRNIVELDGCPVSRRHQQTTVSPTNDKCHPKMNVTKITTVTSRQTFFRCGRVSDTDQVNRSTERKKNTRTYKRIRTGTGNVIRCIHPGLHDFASDNPSFLPACRLVLVRLLFRRRWTFAAARFLYQFTRSVARLNWQTDKYTPRAANGCKQSVSRSVAAPVQHREPAHSGLFPL